MPRLRVTRGIRGRNAPTQSRLYSAVDHGRPISLDPAAFIGAGGRNSGWGPFAELFVRQNERALKALDVEIEVAPSVDGALIRLKPGGSAGAVPLKAPQSGKICAGVVVKPRFGWSGVGSVLHRIGWQAGPQFLEQPLVPGSGREVPPWVIAGPVLARLEELLSQLRRGYRQREDTLRRPRGRILWQRYRIESLARGRWDKIPCRYPDLDVDQRIRREIRWTLEHILRELRSTGGVDPVALSLSSLAVRLLELLTDVTPLIPNSHDLNRTLTEGRLLNRVVRNGLQAISWVAEERGLGGGREMDGLSWALPLEKLWEMYVESEYRQEAAVYGGVVKAARKGETVFPLDWTDPSHKTLGSLIPDIVIHRGDTAEIVDAKYKAHFAELDESAWRDLSGDIRDSHRADLHQVLAYAALFDVREICATLVYPLRLTTFEALRERGRDVSTAELFHGGRRVTLKMRGIPFGGSPGNR